MQRKHLTNSHLRHILPYMRKKTRKSTSPTLYHPLRPSESQAEASPKKRLSFALHCYCIASTLLLHCYGIAYQ